MRSRWLRVGAVAALCFLLSGLAVQAARGEVVKNGGFEEGFVYGVGKYWGSFDNGGLADCSFHDDDWDPVVRDGEHSQLIEISTLAYGGSEPDRYAGIYQVVDVVPGARYDFTLHGMIRSTEGTEEESEYGYRVEVGLDYAGGTDWQAVTDWTEMPWPEYPRLEPGAWKDYYASVYPTGNQLTIFIRARKKFATTRQEGNINIDTVSMMGSMPTGEPAPSVEPTPVAEADAPETMPVTGFGLAAPIAGALCGALALVARKLRLRG